MNSDDADEDAPPLSEQPKAPPVTPPRERQINPGVRVHLKAAPVAGGIVDGWVSATRVRVAWAGQAGHRTEVDAADLEVSPEVPRTTEAVHPPRVTPEEWAKLAEAQRIVKEAGERIDEIRKRLGMPDLGLPVPGRRDLEEIDEESLRGILDDEELTGTPGETRAIQRAYRYGYRSGDALCARCEAVIGGECPDYALKNQQIAEQAPAPRDLYGTECPHAEICNGCTSAADVEVYKQRADEAGWTSALGEVENALTFLTKAEDGDPDARAYNAALRDVQRFVDKSKVVERSETALRGKDEG